MVDIYQAAKRRGKYPPLATDTEANNASVNGKHGPRVPGHSGEFNFYPVLKDGLFPTLGANKSVKSPV